MTGVESAGAGENSLLDGERAGAALRIKYAIDSHFRPFLRRGLLIITRIMDMSSRVILPVSLEALPRRQHATVAAIDWARLAVPEARRLRELGFRPAQLTSVGRDDALGLLELDCLLVRA